MKVNNKKFIEDIRQNKIKIVFLRKPTAEYLTVFPKSKLLKISLLLPYVLPFLTIIVYTIIVKKPGGLVGIAVYLLLPSLLGNLSLVLNLMTIFGIYGIQKQWSPLFIAILLPGTMCFLGHYIHQKILEWFLMRKVLSGVASARQLEREKFVVFKQGERPVSLIK